MTPNQKKNLRKRESKKRKEAETEAKCDEEDLVQKALDADPVPVPVAAEMKAAGERLLASVLAYQKTQSRDYVTKKVSKENFEKFIQLANSTGNTIKTSQAMVDGFENVLGLYPNYEAFAADPENRPIIRDGLGGAFRFLFSARL